MAIEDSLHDLETSKRIASSRLVSLSNLSPADLERFLPGWRAVAAPERRRMVEQLVELAEDDVELDFDAVFRACLSDPDPGVRSEAIEGLWECEERWLTPLLLKLFHNDPSEEVRATAATALGRFVLLAELDRLPPREGARIADALFGVLANADEPVAVRRRAIEAISTRTDPRVANLIESTYQSEDQQLRASALHAMGHTCDDRWLDVLFQELSSPSAEMRYEAATACGEIEDVRAVPHLIPLLGDEDLEVSISAVGALGHIGGPLARKALHQAQNQADPRMRDAIEEALEEAQFADDPLLLD